MKPEVIEIGRMKYFSATSTAAFGHMGVSAPENRAVFFELVGVDAANIVDMGTEHGNNVIAVDTSNRGTIVANCDALITQTPGLLFALLTGDCLSIQMVDGVHKAIGLIHGGRLGLESGIIKKTRDLMFEKYGSHASDLSVQIGPHVCVDHYEVEAEIAEPFAIYPGAVKVNKTTFLDLEKVAVAQLDILGVKARNISVSPICTVEDVNYFSYRENRTKERFITVTGIVE